MFNYFKKLWNTDWFRNAIYTMIFIFIICINVAGMSLITNFNEFFILSTVSGSIPSLEFAKQVLGFVNVLVLVYAIIFHLSWLYFKKFIYKPFKSWFKNKYNKYKDKKDENK